VTIEEQLAGQSGGKTLDVATEGGWFIKTLQNAFENIDQIIGIDITDEDFDEARERFKGAPVTFLVMNGADLDFADGYFDTVAMCAGMHHLDDIPAVLSEMMRVLKPSGTLVLREGYRDVEDERQLTDVLEHDWYAKIDRIIGRPHFPTLTRQEITDYVNGLGLYRYEIGMHQCKDCPRSKGERVEEEITEVDEQLAKVRGHPQYDELEEERNRIVSRIKTVGVRCQPSLDVVGIK
jgi:SAM-dependent methyltransferase